MTKWLSGLSKADAEKHIAQNEFVNKAESETVQFVKDKIVSIEAGVGAELKKKEKELSTISVQLKSEKQITESLKNKILKLEKEKLELTNDKNRLYKLLEQKQPEQEGKSFIQEQRELREDRIQKFHEKYGRR